MVPQRIYGSDAVAGVVNLIPRRSLDGIEAFTRYGSDMPTSPSGTLVLPRARNSIAAR